MRKHKYYNFAYLKGKASDRKGMGMELALLVLLVVFACSTLLVSSAMINKSNLQTREQELREQLVLDQLAERILAKPNDDALAEIANDPKFADYVVLEKTNDGWRNILERDLVDPNNWVQSMHDADRELVITDSEGAPLLTVALKNNQIIRWSYK